MAKNLYIDASHPNETRVVLKSDDNIEDYEYESINNSLIKNNIYLGKVSRIEPSLQAAFIDFGREKHGFLSFNDIQSDYYQLPQSDLEKIKKEEEKTREELLKKSKEQEDQNIHDDKQSYELYDLQNDPMEEKNIITTSSKQIEQLKKSLRTMRNKKSLSQNIEFDDDEKRRVENVLKKLGYMKKNDML